LQHIGGIGKLADKGFSPYWGFGSELWHNDFNVLGDGHSNRLFSRRMSAVLIPMRRTMKKFNKVAMVLASAAFASAAGAQTVDNWRDSSGTAWKNGTAEQCWRDASWTPAKLHPLQLQLQLQLHELLLQPQHLLQNLHQRLLQDPQHPHQLQPPKLLTLLTPSLTLTNQL